MLSRALSIKASGLGSEYLSNNFLSKLPAFTPILIEQLLFFAALITSLTFSFEPILPGLILKQLASFSAVSIDLF